MLRDKENIEQLCFSEMSEPINCSFSVVFSGRCERFSVQTLVKGAAANYS